MHLLSFTALAAIVAAVPVQAQDTQHSPAIVVTGSSLDQTARRLDACIAGQCDPKRDIDASIAHAENQFLAGDYAAARATLAGSVRRNARYRATMPVDVADLQRAYGRLVDVTGQPNSARIVQIDALDSLKTGLDRADQRVFVQRMLVGDQFAQAGRIRAATDVYRKVERQAAKAGLPQVSALAVLRRAKLFGTLVQFGPAYRDDYAATLAQLERLPGAEMGQFRLAAAVLRAQDAARRNDESQIDAVIATMDASQRTRPYLIYAPAIELHPIRSAMPPSSAGRPAEWADVRVVVRPDGRVEDCEVLRQSGQLDQGLMRKVTDSIARRRYTPYLQGEGKPLAYRIERFSFVQDWWTGENRMSGNSRVRKQNVDARLAWMDLTPDDAPMGTGTTGS